MDSLTIASNIRRTLASSEPRDAVRLMEWLLISCMGPGGKLKMIQNVSGGHVTLTSSSVRLFSSIKVSNPILKVANDTVIRHQRMHGDLGLYLGSLILKFLMAFSGLDHSPALTNHIATQVIKCLKIHLEQCHCHIKLSLNSASPLVVLAKSILSSKPGMGFSKIEINEMAKLLVKTYLTSFPKGETEVFGEINYLLQEGLPPMETICLQGLLIGPECLHFSGLVDKADKQNLKIVLFGCSLSGDTVALEDTSVAVQDVNLLDVIVEDAHNVLKKLVKDGIGIVACQKVIHPRLKQLLINQGIVAVDRLGSQPIRMLSQLTDAEILPSLSTAFDSSNYGYIHTMEFIQFHNRNYLCFKNNSSNIQTLLIANRYEEALEETKTTFMQTLGSLNRLLFDSWVVVGAGCLEIHLAAFLRAQVKNVWHAICTREITIGHVSSVIEVISCSLEAQATALYNSYFLQAYVDDVHQHLWIARDITSIRSTCACGLIKEKDIGCAQWHEVGSSTIMQHFNCVGHIWFPELGNVIDLASVKLEAIKTALQTSCHLFQIDAAIGVEAYRRDIKST